MLSRRQLVLIVTRSCLRVVRNIKKEEVWPAIQNFTDQVHHRNYSIMPVILPCYHMQNVLERRAHYLPPIKLLLSKVLSEVLVNFNFLMAWKTGFGEDGLFNAGSR